MNACAADDLGRLLHYLAVQRESIFKDPASVETSWASDGRCRALWLAQGRALYSALLALGWAPPVDASGMETARTIHDRIERAKK